MTLGPFSLHGAYLVTGGTRGIGRAVSERFARSGARVIANHLRDERAAAELSSLALAEDLRIGVVRADLMQADGIRQLQAHVEGLGEPMRGLVHCAATGTHRKIEDLTGRHLDWTYALNARALFDLVQSLLPTFDRNASIVAISSLGAVRALPAYAAVGASKGALEALARHMAAELAPRGIRTNILVPGAVATDAWKSIPDAKQRLAEAAQRTPIGRLVTAEEVALSAQFLCSDAAAGINGHSLIVDGGAAIVG